MSFTEQLNARLAIKKAEQEIEKISPLDAICQAIVDDVLVTKGDAELIQKFGTSVGAKNRWAGHQAMPPRSGFGMSAPTQQESPRDELARLKAHLDYNTKQATHPIYPRLAKFPALDFSQMSRMQDRIKELEDKAKQKPPAPLPMLRDAPFKGPNFGDKRQRDKTRDIGPLL